MPEASYVLSLELKPRYLHAVIQGTKDSYETTLGAVTEIASFCKDRKISKVLIEHTIPGRLSTLEVYKVAAQLPDLYRGIHVAFVIHLAETPDNPRFLENVARNRGGEGRLFSRVEDAEKWLLSL